ncbi:hypothetical protein [Zymobacter sp. IVIA_5232.4 C2]|uniref:hypothetical protein n=1 Tax=Zymobacter sp. IVIA_5232.4 C2 TaxID=3394855 RepID=UPI0039C4CCE4
MQDIHRFEATSVSCFSENGVDIIGLSDDDQEPEHFVVLMQMREEGIPGEQSIEMQTEATGRPVTGSFMAVRLAGHHMQVALTEEWQELLGYGTIEVILPERHEHQLLAQYLHLCLDDTAIELTIDN